MNVNNMEISEQNDTEERKQGIQLFFQQYVALLKKNILLTWRRKSAAILQIFAPIFFVFLAFACNKAFNARFRSSSSQEVMSPEYQTASGIPRCEEGYFINVPCYDFIWSGHTGNNSVIPRIVSSIMTNNPGRRIPSSKVRGFNSSDEAHEWLIANPMRCTGALHFMDRGDGIISYGLQTNSTEKIKRRQTEDSTMKFMVPLQVSAERAIARVVLGDSSISWMVGLKEFAHPAMEKFSPVKTFLPTFFLAAAMYGFVIQLGSLVFEREQKLRQAMSIMGLFDSAYWLSWMTWDGFLALISAILLTVSGILFQLNFFTGNSYSVVFLTFFLFQINMVGFAFFVSLFVSKSSSATTAGFAVFIIGFVTQLVTQFGFPYSTDFSKEIRIIWSVFPPNLFSEGLNLLDDATSTKSNGGISWAQRSTCPTSNSDCVITMDDIFKLLGFTFFLWILLAIYLDNVLPDANGVKKPFLYFLKLSYWTGKSSNQEEVSCCSCKGSRPQLNENSADDEDVKDEELLVKQQVIEKATPSNVAIHVCGLVKSFPESRQIFCCKCKRTAPYHAVKGVWMNVEKDKLFCLLGHNGAGKTTIINCLTGIVPLTHGDALVYGDSIKNSSGRARIQSLMGVCPQFDILWETLSAKEHMDLFASLKGMSGSSIKSDTESLLSQVRLSKVADSQVGRYSGGMKRRLSVAIALIGDPKLVFLDEPTTGMDPVIRRHVWDIIENAKRGRAIVLTTHSMEEADILSDRIAIMGRGKLQCIGSSTHLKSRFGDGFIINVNIGGDGIQHLESGLQDANESLINSVKQIFKERLNVDPKRQQISEMMFVIPQDKEERLMDLFAEVDARGKELGITDIRLCLPTLEEVFLNITKHVEAKHAEFEGCFMTLTLPSGKLLQVPTGSRFAKIPETLSVEHPEGLMVEVYWSLDETGSLVISGHSDETPVTIENR